MAPVSSGPELQMIVMSGYRATIAARNTGKLASNVVGVLLVADRDVRQPERLRVTQRGALRAPGGRPGPLANSMRSRVSCTCRCEQRRVVIARLCAAAGDAAPGTTGSGMAPMSSANCMYS